MKFNPSKPLTDLRDVINFFEFLYLNEFANYHPDDDFTTYVHTNTGNPSWSKAEGEMLNKRMEEAFEVCDRLDKDIYQVAAESDILSDKKLKRNQLFNKSKKQQRARKQQR